MIIVIGVPVLAIVCLVVAGVTWFNTVTANRAQPYIDPFVSRLESIGGHRICDNGDAGVGPDNLTPWYEVYYLVPRGASATAELKEVAARNGYVVQLNHIVPPGEVAPAVEFDDPNPSRSLQVKIYRNEGVPLYCGDGSDYGRIQWVSGSGVIVEVGVELARNRL
jgi:hypothetical protein